MRYVSPFTDFGFKKLFGSEESKTLLMSFLNDLLELPNPIGELEFRNLEQLGESPLDRKAIFDIYCTDTHGQHFIVEMQNAKQEYFLDRTLFYSSFLIQAQAERGHWNFKLMPVYCVGLLNFSFQDSTKDYLHRVNLKDQHNEIFFDQLNLIYIEFPNFTKAENELVTHLDKMLYFIKNIDGFKGIPKIFSGDDEIKQGFAIAELAQMDDKQQQIYHKHLKTYRDNINAFDFSFKEVKLKVWLKVKLKVWLKVKLKVWLKARLKLRLLC